MCVVHGEASNSAKCNIGANEGIGSWDHQRPFLEIQYDLVCIPCIQFRRVSQNTSDNIIQIGIALVP